MSKKDDKNKTQASGSEAAAPPEKKSRGAKEETVKYGDEKDTPAPVTIFLNDQEFAPLNVAYARLSKETLAYSYYERTATRDFRTIEVKKSSTVNHPDLLAAFAAFNGHLAIVCEEVQPEEIEDIETLQGINDYVSDKLQHFLVHSVALEGSINAGGTFVLNGVKILSTAEEVGLLTPKKIFDPEYQFYNELYAAATTLIEEVSLYHYGKAAPPAQQAIKFVEEELNK